jgi:hypothetical protein
MFKPARMPVLALALAQALLLSARECAAAVIIIWGDYTAQHNQRIEVIQGHREWLAIGPKLEHPAQATSAVIDDLDKGIRTQIDYVRKTYTQEAFPQAVEGVNGGDIDAWKPTGRSRRIAGYWCEEYMGIGDSAHWGHLTETECVSKDAAGVAEYEQFSKLMDSMLLKAGYPVQSHRLSGIPLAESGDCCGGPSGSFVTKVESRAVPQSQFEPPPGFVKVSSPVRNRRNHQGAREVNLTSLAY